VCSHRHAQLCTAGLHTGPVRCPYHGWVYDREGVPVGIPRPEAFPAVVASPAAHRLTEFACEAVGEFIFVRLSAEGPSLLDYLGNEGEFLQRASQGMHGLLDEFRSDVAANWKVVIENSLEGYHVPAVHNQTFMQVEGMQQSAEAPVDHLEHPLHSHMDHPAEPQWLARFSRSIEPKIGAWSWRFPNYTHHHVFPNLTVTSFMGYSFHVQSFEPSAIDRCTVHSRTVATAFENQSVTGAKMMQRIHAEGHAFTHRVFEEDTAICARVMAGLQQAERKAVLADGLEDRVAHFQRACLNSFGAT
jgi:phenylpropionate dioxygenase-like ring-hydroxylating dioxygenase large terminal subunit